MAAINQETLKEVYIVCITFITFIMVAACRTIVAFQVPQLESLESDIKITSDQGSWIAALTILPNPIGSLLGGFLMDLIGRKRTLQLIFVPSFISWCIIGFSTNVHTVCIGTFVNGVISGACYCSSLYTAEICTAEHRGPMLGLLEPTYTFGGLLCSLLAHNFGWRQTSFCFACIALACFCLMFLLPESPTWLVTKGKSTKALKTLTWLRNSPYEAQKEIAEIEDSLTLKKSNSLTMSNVKAVLNSWKPLAMLIGLATLQRISGCPILESYTVIFFDSLKLPFDYNQAAIYHMTANFATSFLTPFAVQRFRRKFLLGSTCFVMGICMLVVAAYESLYYNNSSQPYFWIVLVSIYLYDVASTLGFLPLPFILSGELFPTENRGMMNGIYGCFSFLISAGVVKMFPKFLQSVGIVKTVLSFGIVCLLTVVYGKVVLPETKSKTLPEIQVKYFSKHQSLDPS